MQSQSPAQALAEAPFPDSPADFAGPLEEAQSVEPAQVEPEGGGQHEIGADPVELAAPPSPGPEDLTILQTFSDETDLALAPEPPETDQQVETDPLELAAPPAPGSEDLAATASGLAAIEEKTETILSDLQTIEAETGLALAAERPVPEEAP